MTANQDTEGDGKSPHDAEESIEILRGSAHRLANDLEALADALENGEADEELVAETVRALGLTYTSVEDAAVDAGTIDAKVDAWRAVDGARDAMIYAAHAIGVGASDREIISPTTEGLRSDAIASATSSAEYSEAARDGPDP
jgi:Arc/MetJ family transcription regulator